MKIPCVDCLTLATCKSKLKDRQDENYCISVIITELIEKCSLVKNFIRDERETEKNIKKFGDRGYLFILSDKVRIVSKFLTYGENR